MKITNLTITSERSWELPSEKNPMVAKVKMRDTSKTDLEVVIPEDMMGDLTALLSPLVVAAAKRQISEFVRLTEASQALELSAP